MTTTRRNNVVALYREYAEREIAAGHSAKGLEAQFAALLQISPSMWSMVKRSRPIGDKLARQIEIHGGKEPGWLDEAHETSSGITPAEQQFLDLCLQARRATNATGRSNLRLLMRAVAAGDVPPEMIGIC